MGERETGGRREKREICGEIGKGERCERGGDKDEREIYGKIEVRERKGNRRGEKIYRRGEEKRYRKGERGRALFLNFYNNP